jgi:hypothetical protein
MRNIDIPAKFVKVAVFGDSYADKANHSDPDSETWYEILKRKHEFNVTSYGKNGASIEFIFNEFYHNYPRYDYVIFIKTASGRVTLPKHIPIPEEFAFLRFNMPNILEQNKKFTESMNLVHPNKALTALEDYYSYLFDEGISGHVCDALALYAKSLCGAKGLFLNVVDDTGSCLMDISNRELHTAGLSLEDMRKYSDKRNCHISKRNNEILADKVARWIDLGEFNLNPDDFEYDTDLDKTKIFNRYDEF